MSQYNIFNGRNWVNASIVGPKGETGPYYIPYLDEDGNFSMESSDESKRRIELGNITGPTGLTGYGYNANLFDNADFCHALRRSINSNTYVCERWYKDDASSLITTFVKNNGGLELISDDIAYLKQNFPYLSPGRYIISVITSSASEESFSFSVQKGNDKEVNGELKEENFINIVKGSKAVIKITKGSEANRYIHYAILEISSELLPTNGIYPSVRIGNKGTNIVYRAKLEIIPYREEKETGKPENPYPTIEQDIMQNQSYTRLATISSDMDGNYLSPFRATTVSIEKSKWSLESDGMYYADAPAIADAIGSCHVIVAAEPNSAAEFADYSIVCVDHEPLTGELTFRAAGIPDKTIESNILVVRY